MPPTSTPDQDPTSSAHVHPAPSGTCDAHFHVFGPTTRYPMASDSLHGPVNAPVERYLDITRSLGIERFVVVQPSGYGTDNACTLDALRELGTDRARAVVVIDDQSPPGDEVFRQWHALGARSFRVLTHAREPDQALVEPMAAKIRRLERIAVDLGWHLDLLFPGWLTELMLPTLEELSVDFSVAHLGWFPVDAADSKGFKGLLRLASSGERRCWPKLTGFYRLPGAEGLTAASELVDAAIEAAPDRVLWGTDHPHVFFKEGTFAAPQMLAALRTMVSDEGQQRKVLVENPAALYGFGPV